MESNTGRPQTPWDNPGMVVVMTLLAVLFCMGLGGWLGNLVAQWMGVNVSDLTNSATEKSLTLAERQSLRWFNLTGHLVGFTASTLLVAYLARGRDMWAFLGFRTWHSGYFVLLATVALIVGTPLIGWAHWLNAALPLPQALMDMEDSQNWLVAEVLRVEYPWELLMALLVAAVVPALGEELLFRGMLQPQLQRLTAHPHLGIWLTAFIFSAIHFQFVGFLPRMLLGAFLGYMYWWSASLWVPIGLHFLFNGVQVVGVYLRPDLFDTATESDAIIRPDIWLGLGSLVLVVVLLRSLRQMRRGV
jgi:membrane protease YdiL (CAAX protease family)